MREISREICAHRSAERREGVLTAQNIVFRQVLALRLSARASRRENSKERRCAHQPHELGPTLRFGKFMGLMSTPNGVTQEF